MATIFGCGRLLRATACLGIVFTMRRPLWAQSPALSITLTGQSMIRSDIRAHAPSAVPAIESLLKGDVVFTNFEATIVDERKGQSHKDGRFLSPPEALDALKIVRLQPGVAIQQSFVRSQGRGHSEHARGGEAPEPGSCRNREHRRGSCRARLPAHAQGHGCAGGDGIRSDCRGRVGHRNPAGRE